MVTHTIEELHELFKSGELDVKEYYKELFEEAKKQQERLNAFVTITTLRVLRQLHLVRC